MSLSEGYAHGQSTALSVQAKPGAGVTTLVVADVRFLNTNLGPAKTGDVVLFVDGDPYLIKFVFTDESIDQRTLQGYTKKRNPDSEEN